MVADDLRAARKLIERPEAWVKGTGAEDERGLAVWSGSKAACRWCVEGALDRVTVSRIEKFLPAHKALKKALPNGFENTWRFNDAPTTTHADILALFDRAIAAAEERAE